MIKYNKKIQTFVFLVVITSIVFILLNNIKQKLPGVSQNNKTDKQKQEDYKESIRAPRQFLLKQLNTNGEEYIKHLTSTTNIIDKKIYAEYYPENISQEVFEKKLTQYYNHSEDEMGKFRGGIIVFTYDEKIVNIIWESKEIFSEWVGRVEFKDIDNDSIDELVLKGGYGSPQNPDYYIYKWKKDGFYLINPHPESNNLSDRLMLGNGADLRDVDNDKIYEVITVVEEDKYDPKSVKRYTYKFNGFYYYLWKEEPNKEPLIYN